MWWFQDKCESLMVMCLFSWASMDMPTLSPTMATSCLILTCDLWYGEMFYYRACSCEITAILLSWQYKEGKKLKPKPNYNSVDLSEVEWEDTEEKVSIKVCSTTWCNQGRSECVMPVLQLRTAMVQGQTGTLSLDVRSSVDKGVSKDSTVDFPSDFMH